MRFELEPNHRDIKDEDLIADLKRVAVALKSDTVSWDEYERSGTFSAETLRRRFGAWNSALNRAGLEATKRWRIPEGDLLENLGAVWMRLGCQPRRQDLVRAVSRVSASVYEQRYGSWRQALEAFVAYANAREPAESRSESAGNVRRSTLRSPSLRLRFRVMRRDHFSCRVCGASPAKDSKVELHVDHIAAWSKGGDTILDNLQTLCSRCNLGKGDLDPTEA